MYVHVDVNAPMVCRSIIMYYLRYSRMQVGSDFFETTLYAMNTFGRVSVCGAISTYNASEPATSTYILFLEIQPTTIRTILYA